MRRRAYLSLAGTGVITGLSGCGGLAGADDPEDPGADPPEIEGPGDNQEDSPTETAGGTPTENPDELTGLAEVRFRLEDSMIVNDQGQTVIQTDKLLTYGEHAEFPSGETLPWKTLFTVDGTTYEYDQRAIIWNDEGIGAGLLHPWEYEEKDSLDDVSTKLVLGTDFVLGNAKDAEENDELYENLAEFYAGVVAYETEEGELAPAAFVVVDDVYKEQVIEHAKEQFNKDTHWIESGDKYAPLQLESLTDNTYYDIYPLQDGLEREVLYLASDNELVVFFH